MSSSQEERQANFHSNVIPVFVALSADVLINVINFLPPCDIISVRQTCRTLLLITKLRTVWVNALRGVMEEYFITEDTFPLETMSLSMLEHSALSPRRFVSLMERSDNRKLEPTSTRVLSPRLTNREKAIHGLSENGKLYDMFLAPGGRYLSTVALCNGDSSHFTIWDLGLSGSDGIKALAHLVQPVEDCLLVNLFPDLKQRGVFYLVVRPDSDSLQGIIIDVHTITISPSSPEFTSISRFKIPTSGSTYCTDVLACPKLCRVTLRTEDPQRISFLIWDFIHNTAATWAVPGWGFAPEYTLFSYNDSLIVGRRDKMLIYNIPPFIPYDSEIVPEHLEPSLTLSAPFPTDHFFYIVQNCRPHSQAYTCVIDSDQIIIHEVKNTRSALDSTIPNKLPILVGKINVTDPSFKSDNDDFFGAMEQSNRHLFLGCSNNLGTFTIFMLKVADQPDRQRDIKLTKATLCDDSTVTRPRKQFCPLMGRMCYLTWQTPKLHILDYLVPPE